MNRLLRKAVLLALSIPLILSAGVPARAQDGPPQDGGGRRGGMGGGMFGMAGNSAHGTVTEVSGSDITLKNEQGESWKVVTGPNTHIRRDRQEAKLSDIHPGDVIIAAGNVDGKTIGAAFVVVLDPQQAAEMKKRIAEFGRTWTAGRVTAISDLTLTVERPDKVTQKVTVDENTSFHRRGRGTEEDITFPDIKVGDVVNARGALQGDHFVAATLMVMEPGRGRGRFAQPGGSGMPPPRPEGVPPGATPPQSPDGQQN